MRKFLTLAASSLLFFSAAEAKHQPTVKLHALTKAVLNHKVPTSANKSTGVPSRLVAKATSSYNSGSYQFNDSSRYQYSGQHGSYDAFTDDWDYDKRTDYQYTGSQYDNSYRSTKTYDASNRLATILDEQWNGSAWENYIRGTVMYTGNDIAGGTGEMWNGSTWDPLYKTSFTYDGNHNLLTTTDEEWNGSSYDITYRNTMTYNASSQVLTSTDEEDQGSGLDFTYRTTYTYTGTQLTMEVEEEYISGSWQNSSRILYTYDANNNAVTTETEQWNGSSWDKDGKETRTFDGNHNMLTNIHANWTGSSYEPGIRITNTYNGYNQMLTQIIDAWDGSAFVPSNGMPYFRNYYEMFNNDVKKTAVQNASLKTYPVPAGNELNIELNFKQPAAFAVTISDMTGKVMAAWTEQPVAQYRKTINTANLPSGNYILRVSAGTEQLQQKLNIVK